jgi:hypothetical protein
MSTEAQKIGKANGSSEYDIEEFPEDSSVKKDVEGLSTMKRNFSGEN